MVLINVAGQVKITTLTFIKPEPLIEKRKLVFGRQKSCSGKESLRKFDRANPKAS
jgi:hypothetical protein